MEPSVKMIEAYEKGKKLKGVSWEKIVYQKMVPDSYFLNDVLNLFFDAGYYNKPMPEWVRGWRYGKIPAGGRSTNYRDGHSEAGVSVMEAVTKKSKKYQTQDWFSAMFLTGQKVPVEGWLHSKRGSDGEPLLVGCREVKNTKG